MRRALVMLIATSMTFGVAVPSAAATARLGGSCTKAGSTAQIAGKKLVCTKVGKKLIWRVAPAASGGGQGATSAGKAYPIPAVRPATFAELEKYAAAVPYWAWKDAHDALLAHAPAKVPTRVLTGPNTTKDAANGARGIATATQLFSNPHPTGSLTIIYYAFQDRDWAQARLREVNPKISGNEAASSCQSATTCWGAQGAVSPDGVGYMLVAVPARSDANHTSGSLEAHEWTHVLQTNEFWGSSKWEWAWCCSKAFLPWYYVEGHAEYAQTAAVYSATYDAYLKERKSLVAGVRNPAITIAWLTEFLSPAVANPGERQSWLQYDNWRLYDVGFAFIECLVALKGIDSTMQLFADIASGKTYEEAFQANFGTAWPEAVPLLAKAIHAMAQNIAT